MLRAGRALLTQTLQETEAQIKRLLEVKRLLEHDWSDKQEAFQLDHSAAKLVNHAVKAQFKVSGSTSWWAGMEWREGGWGKGRVC